MDFNTQSMNSSPQSLNRSNKVKKTLKNQKKPVLGKSTDRSSHASSSILVPTKISMHKHSVLPSSIKKKKHEPFLL